MKALRRALSFLLTLLISAPSVAADLRLEDFRVAGDVGGDSAAIERMFEAAHNGDTLYATGQYQPTRTIAVTKVVHLVGGGEFMSLRGPGFYFRHNDVGLRFDVQGATIVGINLYHLALTPGTAPNPNAHGIRANWKFTAENCRVSGFPGDGFHIEAPTTLPNGTRGGNANGFRITGGMSDSNGGHGVYVHGADSNAGRTLSLDVEGNRKWGVFDDSFLGDEWLGLQAHANRGDGPPPGVVGTYVGGSYRATGSNNNQRSVFFACYQEEDNAARVDGRSMWFGMGNTTGTGAILLLVGNGLDLHGQIKAVGPASVLPNGTKLLPVESQLGSSAQHTALEWGELGSPRFGLTRIPDGTGRFVMSHATRSGAPMLGMTGVRSPEGPGFLQLPLSAYRGFDSQALREEWGGATPPAIQAPSRPWKVGDAWYVARPVAGGPSSFRLVGVDAAGKLTWAVQTRLEK